MFAALGILSPLIQPVVKYGAIVLTVLGVLFGLKRLVNKAVEAESWKRAQDVTRESKKLDNRIRNLSDDELDNELRSARDRHKSKGWR